jgi:plastocyanin
MRTKALRLALASLVASGLVFVPGVSLGAPVKIKATANDTWNPDFQHINPGRRVVWINPARFNQDHDLTAYGGNWRKRVMLFPGDRTAKRFRRVGVYKYRCRLHSQKPAGEPCSGMCGVIHVAR